MRLLHLLLTLLAVSAVSAAPRALLQQQEEVPVAVEPIVEEEAALLIPADVQIEEEAEPVVQPVEQPIEPAVPEVDLPEGLQDELEELTVEQPDVSPLLLIDQLCGVPDGFNCPVWDSPGTGDPSTFDCELPEGFNLMCRVTETAPYQARCDLTDGEVRQFTCNIVSGRVACNYETIELPPNVEDNVRAVFERWCPAIPQPEPEVLPSPQPEPQVIERLVIPLVAPEQTAINEPPTNPSEIIFRLCGEPEPVQCGSWNSPGPTFNCPVPDSEYTLNCQVTETIPFQSQCDMQGPEPRAFVCDIVSGRTTCNYETLQLPEGTVLGVRQVFARWCPAV